MKDAPNPESAVEIYDKGIEEMNRGYNHETEHTPEVEPTQGP